MSPAFHIHVLVAMYNTPKELFSKYLQLDTTLYVWLLWTYGRTYNTLHKTIEYHEN